MSTLIGDLNSIQISDTIKWYFYVCEMEAPEPTLNWFRANLPKLGEEFGTSAMLVVPYNEHPSAQILEFLKNNLEPEIGDNCWQLFQDGVAIVATNRPLPNTDAMAVIPICKRHASPDSDPAVLAQIKRRLETLIWAIREGEIDLLLKADPEIFQIQQGHFDVGPLTDWGVFFLKALHRYAPVKIPLWLTNIEISKYLNDLLEKRYPKVSRM
jgi:hypothetical protein